MTADEPGQPDHDGRPRRTRRLLAGAGVVAVVAAVLVGWTVWPRGTTEITHEDAVAGFRSDNAAGRGGASPGDATGEGADGAGAKAGADTGSGQSASSAGAGRTPAPGVYSYAASGSEQVKLGPFPTQDRPLPDEVTVVVSDPERSHDTACFEWTLNLFAEHTESTNWCVGAEGTLELADHTKHQSIGALSPTATVSCDPNLLVGPTVVGGAADGSGTDTGSGTNTGSGAAAGTEAASGDGSLSLECELHLEGGPAAISAGMAGTSTISASETLDIGSDTVEVTPVVVDYEVTGDLSGTWTEKYWLDDRRLPVRIDRDIDLAGPATLTEHSRLELRDLAPAL